MSTGPFLQRDDSFRECHFRQHKVLLQPALENEK